MRIARKLALLLTMAIAAMALAATTASADEAVGVVDEATGNPCAPTCTIHVAGESSLSAFHVITVSNCTDEFTATLDANGNGEVDTWDGVDDASACTREQCTDSSGAREHWPISTEEIADDTVELGAEFCLSPRNGDMSDAAKARCDVDAIIVEHNDPNHDYEIDLSHECNIGGNPVEVHGDWDIEGTDFEFVHAP